MTGRFNLTTSLYLAAFAFVGYLLFHNLDGHLLWGDEAENALLAKNVLVYGVPKSFDGLNRITIYGASVDSNSADIWTWTPWLQEYVAAAGFVLFGQTTWGGRVLFTLVGFGCVGLLGLVAHRVYRNHWITLASILLLGTSEVFLLHSRQCRYYSISVFAEVMLIYGIHQLLEQNRKGIGTVALALILQFYSNYIIAAANIPTLLVVAWTLYREKKSSALMVAAALAAVFAACLPWLIYADVFRQFHSTGEGQKFATIQEYLLEFNFHFIPWIFVLLPVLGWAVARYRPQQESAQAAAPITRLEGHLLALLPLYLGVLTLPPDRFLRYLLPLLPVGCLLAAAWVFRYVKWRAVAVALVLIQCSSNALAWLAASPWRPWRFEHVVHSPIVKYIEGIHRPYTDQVGEVAGFFNREGGPGQTVFSFDPEFALIFYTGLGVIDARLNGGKIPDPMPDWILQVNASGLKDDVRIYLSGVATNFYETITIAVPNTRRDGGIPQPDVYQYETTPTRSDFVIYKKKKIPTLQRPKEH